MSLSRNEMNTIKKAIKESIQAYVDIKIANAQYAFTEIATVTAEHWDDLSNDIEVKGKATYTHVISVGKIVYPVGSVVYCFIPNNQYNNMFILGKLDKVPAQITGGTIGIGRIGAYDPPQYSFYVDSNGNVTITKGSINLGNGNFVVDSHGNTTIKNGDINITSGNLHIGWNSNYNDYNFAVENDGSVRAYDGSFYGHVSASSGNFGKFRINVTDGLLDYEDNSNGYYVYLGKTLGGACGLYVSDRALGASGSVNYVSIAKNGIQISDDTSSMTTEGGSTIWGNYDNESLYCTIDYRGIDLSHGGEISFGTNIFVNGICNESVYRESDEHNMPTAYSVYLSCKDAVYQATSEAHNNMVNYVNSHTIDGITAGTNGTTTLSTSGTSSYYMSSYGGKITSTYGHQLAIPSSGTSSDVRLKEQISDMPNIEDVYNNIKLHKFKYHKDIVDTLPTYHWGVIAQELEENLKNNGYNEDDYSIVFKGNQNAGFNEDKYVGDDKVYRLWSSDFDAMHIQMIQKLWKRCDELEEEIKELKERKGH